MTVFDSRLSSSVQLTADQAPTPGASTSQVGWVAALVWPAVSTAVVAGALLGPAGMPLLWAGIVGAVAMIARQLALAASRRSRRSGLATGTSSRRPRS